MQKKYVFLFKTMIFRRFALKDLFLLEKIEIKWYNNMPWCFALIADILVCQCEMWGAVHPRGYRFRRFMSVIRVNAPSHRNGKITRRSSTAIVWLGDTV